MSRFRMPIAWSSDRRGQYALETIFVVGFASALLFPTMMLFYQFASGSSEEIISNQVDSIGKSIAKNAEVAYSYGKHTRIQVEYSFPDLIHNMTIENNNSLVISVMHRSGKRDYFYPMDINVTGEFDASDYTPGKKVYEFRVIKEGEQVLIQRV